MKKLLFALLAFSFISLFAADSFDVPGENQNIESVSIFLPCDCVAPAVEADEVYVFVNLDVENTFTVYEDIASVDYSQHNLCSELYRCSENINFTSISTTDRDWLGFKSKGMPVDDTLFKHQRFLRDGQLVLYS